MTWCSSSWVKAYDETSFSIEGQILKSRPLVNKGEFDRSGGSVSLFCNDDLSHSLLAFQILRPFVQIFSINEKDDIRILLD